MDCKGICLALKELSSSIEEVGTSPSNFVLHRTQCYCLARSYALTVDYVIQQIRHNSSVCNDQTVFRNLLPSLSELHHAMLQGRKFMQDCSFQDGWVSTAVVLALTSEAQDVCLHDLVWCLYVIRQAMGQLSFTVPESQIDVFSSLSSIWGESSQKDDTATLINVLTHEIALWEHELSLNILPTKVQEEVKAQARFLLQKLLRETNFHEVGASDDTILECLWVDPAQLTIKEAIGRGAFAVVYDVEWCGQRYGQKEFLGVVDKSYFTKEAAIQARLRHPNVLQLICCTSKPLRSTYSLVTELMEMDLRSAINNRCRSGFDPPFPILTAVDLMLQIAKGMEYLHDLDIIHRDLKSFNVLVSSHVSSDRAHDDGRMRVVIADFGVSKLINSKCTSSKYTTFHAGTTNWRAPEVLEVDGHKVLKQKYTKKADVYSFAMVGYEILTGKVPFDDSGQCKELRKRLLRGERPLLPTNCPQYLASYIERCWDAKPKKRPSFTQISRTLRHLKGILLSSVDPFFSSALTCRSCSDIEDKLEGTMGADWILTAPSGLRTRSLGITFEMFWYKVMESKLTNQQDAVAVKHSTDSTRDFRSTLVGCFRWAFGQCGGQGQDAIHIDPVECFQRSIQRFTYKELISATQGFNSIINKYGAGQVFKGILANGQVVAVKTLSGRSKQLHKTNFLTELELLDKVRHCNLVPLLGFCCEREHLLLVHKFMPGGDLANLGGREIVLSWAQKYNIVCGLASALNYLHNECSPPVLHRNVNPSNILLDDNQEACLADFGIARLLTNSETHLTTVPVGTNGYIAPEYVTTLKLGTEADVYSFGIVVLELACGRRYFERDATISHILVYVWTLYQQGRLLDAGHEGIERDCDKEELLRLLHLGLACTQSNPRDRPSMSRVVQIVSKEVEAPPPARMPYHMEPPNVQVHVEGQP